MDLYRLSMFAQVYDCRSFTEAARRLFVSRQAVSKAVSQLEGELGPLFERLPRGVRPTSLAEELYPHVRGVLDECATVERLARRYAEGRAGLVSLVLESNAALTLPPGLTSAYAAARRDVRLSVRSMASEQLREALGGGGADFAVTGPQEVFGGCLAFERVLSSGLCVVLSAAALRPDELEGLPRTAGGALVAPLETLGGRTVFGVSPQNHVERQLEPYLRGRGVGARISYEYADTALATSEMEAGAGGVIVETRGALTRFGDARYVHVPFEGDGAPRWEVGVAFRPREACAPIACDFAAFARGFVASARAAGEGDR